MLAPERAHMCELASVKNSDMDAYPPLSDDLLAALVAELDDETLIGIALGGS
jgi:hypothetical protein